MIDNLTVRQSYWNDPKNRAPREEHDITDSIPYPWEPILTFIFDDQDVLEVGPGRGRQYERIKDGVQSYSICDISPVALAETVFVNVTNKLLLIDYSKDFSFRFDVIHFWYVLHHVKTGEMASFFAFIARHLRDGGLVLFNSPQDGNNGEWYTGDGMGTTWMDRGMVRRNYAPYLETLDVYCQDDHSSGDLFVVRKR